MQLMFTLLCRDMGREGMNDMLMASQLEPMSDKKYQRYSRFVMKTQKNFEAKNMPKVHKDVQDYYIRHNLSKKDADGIMDITVAVDGAFSHTKEAKQCSTCGIDPVTGSVLLYRTSEKCFNCEGTV